MYSVLYLTNIQDLFTFQWIKYIDLLSYIIFWKLQTKEILKVTYLVSDAQASVNSGGAVYSITSSGEHTDLLSI